MSSTTSLNQELAARHARLRTGLQELDAVALVATRPSTVTYLTGYTTSTWSNFSRPIIAVLTADELIMVVAETETDSVVERVPGVSVRDYVELLTVPQEMHLPDGQVQFGPAAGRVLGEVVPATGTIAVDGFHAAFPPVAQMTDLVPGLNDRCIDGSELVWRRMLEKSPWEVEKLRTAAGILGTALIQLEETLEPGMTEQQVFQRLASAAFDAGAQGLGYNNVVAGVQRGLFGAPTGRVWTKGDVLYVDGGVLVDGYWADFCRMFTIGTPLPDQAAGYGRALKGLREGIASVTADTTAADLCRTIQHVTDLDPSDVGFGRFGHGLGLYMPEPPSIHLEDKTRLAANNVVCVEPAVLHEGGNYVVEEEYFFSEGEIHLLSPNVPDELIVIE
jgi:Xaa-Pro aminopeptidase